MNETKDEGKKPQDGLGSAEGARPAEGSRPAESARPAEGPITERDLFLGLIQSFQAAAMQQMGKVMNPFTEKIERDMTQARLSIEMLEMLKTRTSGNLTGQEARFLNHVLTELRLNFVAETERDKAEP
jgi:hypothetical protein